jgi:hypothetical protein
MLLPLKRDGGLPLIVPSLWKRPPRAVARGEEVEMEANEGERGGKHPGICLSSRTRQSFWAFSYASKMLRLNVLVHINISQNGAVLTEMCSPLQVPAA